MQRIRPVRFETGRPKLMAGLRRHHSFVEAGEGIARQWRDFLDSGPVPGQVGLNRYGVMCGSGPTGFEYLCGVEVGSWSEVPQGAGRLRLEAQRYAVFLHPGDPVTLRESWLRIFDWLGGSGYTSAHKPDFEVYGPGADPLEPVEGMEIWVAVVRLDPVGP